MSTTPTTQASTTQDPFAAFRQKAWPIRYRCTLQITETIVGGTPNNPKIVEGWLRTKLEDSDTRIRALIAETMEARGVSQDDAIGIATKEQNVNGFCADARGLYIGGRQVKAAIKEAANISVASGRLDGRSWGVTSKGLMGFVAEHVIVPQDRVHLLGADGAPVQKPTGVQQRFVHTFRGSSIAMEEYVEGCTLAFDVWTDWDPPKGSPKSRFDDAFWATLWLTGEQQGIGASRSQGFGRYTVTQWERTK